MVARAAAVTGMIFVALAVVRHLHAIPPARAAGQPDAVARAAADGRRRRGAGALGRIRRTPGAPNCVPVLLFGMMMAIVYRQELALLLAGAVALIVVLAIGHGLRGVLLLMGVTAAAVLNLGRIRSRSKLIYVGLFAGAVAVLLRRRHGHDRRPAARACRCCAMRLLNGLLGRGGRLHHHRTAALHRAASSAC